MNNLKTTPLKDLIMELTKVQQERDKLDLEEYKIMQELWYRIPTLKDDVNMQPKILKKGEKNESNRFIK